MTKDMSDQDPSRVVAETTTIRFNDIVAEMLSLDDRSTWKYYGIITVCYPTKRHVDITATPTGWPLVREELERRAFGVRGAAVPPSWVRAARYALKRFA